MTSTEVIVRFSVEGFHCWAECPIKEVEFLRHRHRHIFHIEASATVSHGDRDIEIILFKRKIQDYMHHTFGTPCEFGSRSCEMIAEGLVREFNLCECIVTEDGENGARVRGERHSIPVVNTDLPTVWIVPIEPVDQRYTEQWYRAVPRVLLSATKGRANVVTVDGDSTSSTTEGGFLNFALTNSYKGTQQSKIAHLFSEGKVKAGDCFVVTDAWNPTVLAIRYMSDMLSIPVSVHGIWHAGAYDPTDLLGRRATSWAAPAEVAMFEACDVSYFATRFHRDLFFRNRPACSVEKSVICGQPHYALVDEVHEVNSTFSEDVSSKFYDFVWPHRLSPDKQDYQLPALLEVWDLFITQHHKLSKKDYYLRCKNCKGVLSLALHENLGIGVMEAVLLGCVPVVPDRCSYSEMYLPEFKFPSEWADGTTLNLSKLIDFANNLINNPPLHLLETQREILRGYLTCDPLLNNITKELSL